MDDEERARPRPPRRTAAEFQREHRVLQELPYDLLRAIPLVEEGTTLARRREFIDLHDPARADFRAEGIEIVRPGQRIVARDEVSAEAWATLREACARVLRRPLRRAG